MRQPIFVKDVPIDEKRISFIELVLSRLARRARKSHTAIITPYPISNAVFGENVTGTVLRYMFPCAGTISKGMIRLGVKPKNEIKLVVSISNEVGGGSRIFILDRKISSVECSLPVKPGDCLSMEICPINPSELITEVWISFLWTPTVKDIEAKSFLIDELENDSMEDLVGE
jgi:hypothetical protein